jgi:hypothetical protein
MDQQIKLRNAKEEGIKKKRNKRIEKGCDKR